MPVTLELVKGRVVRLSLIAPWTVTELQSVYPKAQEYYDAATEKLFSIVNLTRLGNIPAGALRARSSPMLSHPNSGQVIIVGANDFASMMAEVVFKLTNFHNIKFSPTEDEAWAYLQPLLDKENPSA
jgi:hypothetical protein